MSRDASSDSDAIAIPPAPNWYGSNLADWGGADGELYAYAARNSIILLRPSGGGGKHAVPHRGTSGGGAHADAADANATATAAASFTGTLVGHSNRVTALAFAQCGGVEHLLVSGSADKHLRLWDTTARRCIKVLKGHAAEVSAVGTSPTAADLAASGDRAGKVLVWRFGGAGGGADRPLRALSPLDASPVLTLALSPYAERDVAVGHQSGALAVADVSGTKPPKKLPARGAEVHAVAWLPPAAAAEEEEEEEEEEGSTSSSSSPAVSAWDRRGSLRGEDKERDGDAPAVLAVGGRERAVTLWAWRSVSQRVSLLQTLPLPRCPPHLSVWK